MLPTPSNRSFLWHFAERHSSQPLDQDGRQQKHFQNCPCSTSLKKFLFSEHRSSLQYLRIGIFDFPFKLPQILQNCARIKRKKDNSRFTIDNLFFATLKIHLKQKDNMDTTSAQSFLLTHSKCLDGSVLNIKLDDMSEAKLRALTSLELKDPTTMLLISIF